MREIRRRDYSRRTGQAYVGWYKRFVRYHALRHPAEMGEAEIEEFLSHLANDQGVSKATQDQAFNALLFLFKKVLGKDLGKINATRARKRRKLPVVLTQKEVQSLLQSVDARVQLACEVLYGCGLRLTECICLRIKDIDVAAKTLVVRDGKGQKDRMLELGNALSDRMAAQSLTPIFDHGERFYN